MQRPRNRIIAAAVGGLVLGMLGSLPAEAADLAPRCMSDKIVRGLSACSNETDRKTNPPFQDRWCPEKVGRFEARRDSYVSSGGGGYEYQMISDYWDCDKPKDRRCIPQNTLLAACR